MLVWINGAFGSETEAKARQRRHDHAAPALTLVAGLTDATLVDGTLPPEKVADIVVSGCA